MAAALPGPVSPLFGIGLYTDGREQVPFEIGWAEFGRDVRWAHRVLDTWGIGEADHVLISTPNFEGPWASPLVRALRDRRTVHSNSEPYSWDVGRSATFLRLLRFKAFIAMSGETAAGLLRQPECAEALAALEPIWARPEALGPLRAAGLEPAVFAMLGPALALECPRRAGAHVDPGEWQLSPGPDGVTLTTVGDRRHVVRELLVAPAGRLEQAPCPCGLPGPRVTPA
ncbi:hypothetical protein CF165_27420 [Amycolatopsis vastitatis]|uniref:Uncharacterized protein n=2 Tax=Amycolatopsis vastitatis TaxID=1905142 RepID=A0A229SYP7_9PSEU|nr:hypothetical protein CF165_27420 [Amycolatopsis vastitatis]